MISGSCMQSPTDTSCTGEDIGGSDSLPDKVDLGYFTSDEQYLVNIFNQLPDRNSKTDHAFSIFVQTIWSQLTWWPSGGKSGTVCTNTAASTLSDMRALSKATNSIYMYNA